MRIVRYIRRGATNAEITVAADHSYTFTDLRELLEDAGYRLLRLISRNGHYARLEVHQ